MERELIIRKIHAFLHDSPDKPFILKRLGGVSHEDRARRLIDILLHGHQVSEAERQAAWDVAKKADHRSSAADRINLPKGEPLEVDFAQDPVIVHPLSGRAFRAFGTLNEVKPSDLVARVDNVAKDLTDQYPDLERRYWALWRLMLPCLQEGFGDAGGTRDPLGHAWELLPADTRVPDHSIWDHLRAASAFAGALPEPALLYFSVGPVQSFIATARKTQDLWAGSFLLSYLAWTGIREIISELGPESVLFPDLLQQPLVDDWLIRTFQLDIEEPRGEDLALPTIPNCFMALVPAGRGEALARVAADAVRRTFGEIVAGVRNDLEERLSAAGSPGLGGDGIWNGLWKRQTSEFFDMQWVSVPFEDDPKAFLKRYAELCPGAANDEFAAILESYGRHSSLKPNIGTCFSRLYALAAKAMAARKGIRIFPPGEEQLQKCTLCGEREPLHPMLHNGEPCEEFGALRGFWQERIAVAFPQIKHSERLCGVCLTKRFAMGRYFRQGLAWPGASNATGPVGGKPARGEPARGESIGEGEAADRGRGWKSLPLSFPSTQMIATAPFRLDVLEALRRGTTLELGTTLSRFLAVLETLRASAGGQEDHEMALFQDELALPRVWRAAKALGTEDARRLARLGGNWLFEDAWPEETDLSPSLRERRDLLREARSALRRFLAATDAAGIARPTRYLAVLHMDGDRLGAWLSGDLAPRFGEVLHPNIRAAFKSQVGELFDRKRPLSPALQASLSRALRRFNLDVARDLVEQQACGRLVFAGGDDVVALVPLRDLLGVMRRLRFFYSGGLAGDSERELHIEAGEGAGFVSLDEHGRPIPDGERRTNRFLMAMGHRATVSLGAAVFHHSSDLAAALDAARREEAQAKRYRDGAGTDRNAFSVLFSRRGGSGERITMKWHHGATEVIPLLEVWRKAFDEGTVSPGFAHQLAALEPGLGGETLPPERAGTFRRTAFLEQASRLLGRQISRSLNGDDRRALKKALTDSIKTLSDLDYPPATICEAIRGTVFLAREAYR